MSALKTAGGGSLPVPVNSDPYRDEKAEEEGNIHILDLQLNGLPRVHGTSTIFAYATKLDIIIIA